MINFLRKYLNNKPFFFLLGVFVSFPTFKLIAEINEHCWLTKETFGFHCSFPGKTTYYVSNQVNSKEEKTATSSSLTAGVWDPTYKRDDRCTFPLLDERPWVVLSNDGTSVLVLQENAKYGRSNLYGYLDTRVRFFPNNKDLALAYGGGIIELIYLLDFKQCSVQKLIQDQFLINDPDYTFNNKYFLQDLVDISPDGKYVVFQIFEGSQSPHFPGTEKDFSSQDANLVGLWLLNMDSQKANHLIKKKLGNTTVSWQGRYDLIVSGDSCSREDNKCIYNLDSNH